METRDQWYKPNLLYNIHYRPPKKQEPPKMIVETVQFNPSVCTCGEHGCQPQYRMEKRVLWTNKEVCNAKQKSKVNDREKKNEYRESKFEERITNDEKDLEVRFMIEADVKKVGSAESFKERMSGDVEVRSGYKANYAVKEKENEEVEGDDDNDNEKEKENKEECVCKNGVRYSDSKDDICNDEEACNKYDIKENNSNGKSDRDNSEGRNSKGICGEKSIGNDCKSAFDNDCKRGEKSPKEDQIDKDQTSGEGDGVVDWDGEGDDGKNCSENTILISNSDEIAESCIIESKDECLDNEEVGSAFGIMSVYCNSELHSWVRFEGEDASKKIH